MTPRERIKRTLEFKLSDRVGIYDNLPVKTTDKWNKKDFPEFDLALFDADKINAIEYKKAKDKSLFLTFSFSGPFQKASDVLGLENVLVMMAQDPKALDAVFSENVESSINAYSRLKENGFTFDGAWMWSDLAYKNGCYFSIDTYKRMLHSHHVKLCRYFEKQGLPVIFHCDGNCLSLIPLLLKAGIKALNPLEIDSGFGDLEFLKKEYYKDLVLFGNMPALVLEKDKKLIEKVFGERIEIAKAGGGFIYHGDKPVPETVSLENYQFALHMVKKYGGY